jgi:primosomal protein N'
VPDAILRLALPSPLRRLFDYRAAAAWRASCPGMRLRVPFGRREMIGVLVEVADTSEVPAEKLKPAWPCSTRRRCRRRCSSCACGPRSITSTAWATP